MNNAIVTAKFELPISVWLEYADEVSEKDRIIFIQLYNEFAEAYNELTIDEKNELLYLADMYREAKEKILKIKSRNLEIRQRSQLTDSAHNYTSLTHSIPIHSNRNNMTRNTRDAKRTSNMNKR